MEGEKEGGKDGQKELSFFIRLLNENGNKEYAYLNIFKSLPHEKKSTSHILKITNLSYSTLVQEKFLKYLQFSIYSLHFLIYFFTSINSPKQCTLRLTMTFKLLSGHLDIQVSSYHPSTQQHWPCCSLVPS